MPSREPLRFSNLKYMSKSPAHYLESLKGRPDSAALRRGRIVDKLVFGEKPTVFAGDRRSKAYKDFEAANPGADIFTDSEFYDAKAMADSILLNPEHSEAARLLRGGVIKTRIFWDFLGRACSGEPDVAGEFLVDLKTTRCAQPELFKRDADRFAYGAQLAWYRQGLILSGAQPPSACYLVAVETAPPYPVVVLRLTERKIEQGERLCRLWMERLLACEAENCFPGYVQSFVEFDADTELDLTFGDEEAA
jgi:hypothetical protein